MDNNQVLQALQIKIEADVSRAIENLNKLSVALDGIMSKVDSVNALATALNELNKPITPKVNPPDTNAAKAKADELREKLKVLSETTFANIEAKVQVPINDIKAAIKYLEQQKALLPLDADVAPINAKLAILRSELNRKNNINIDTTSAANALGNVNRQANQTVRNFEQVIRDTPSFAISAQQGFIAISNNIGPLQDSFARLAKEAKDSGQSIGKALMSSIGGWNAIGIAISVAVTALTFFLSKTNDSKKKTKDLQDTIKELSNEIKYLEPVSVGQIEGEIAKINALKDAIIQTSDQNIVKRGVEELVKVNEKYFGQLKTSKDLLTDVKKLTDDYTEALVKQAVVKGYTDEISKLAPKLNSVTFDIDELKKQRDEFTKNTNVLKELNSYYKDLDARTAASKRTSASGPANMGLSSYDSRNIQKYLDFEKEIKKLEDSKGQLEKLKNRLTEGIKTSTNELLKTTNISGGDDLTNSNNELRDYLQSRKQLLQSELENINKYSLEYFKKQQEIAKIDLSISNVDVTNPKILANNYQIFNNTIKTINEEARKAKVAVGLLIEEIEYEPFKKTPIIDEFRKLAEDVKKETDNLYNVILPSISNKAERQKLEIDLLTEINTKYELAADAINDKYKIYDLIKMGIGPEPIDLEIQAKINLKESLPTMPDFGQMDKDMGYGLAEFNKQITEKLNKTTDQMKNLMDAAEYVSDKISSLFSGVFDELLSKGTVSIKTITNSLKQLLVELATAIVKAIILKTISTALKLGSGGSSEGVSGFAKFIAEFAKLLGGKKFATGGIVTRPTYGLIGEANQPEAVLPLSYLNNLLDSSGGTGILTAKVSGDDLLFILNRTSRRQKRSY